MSPHIRIADRPPRIQYAADGVQTEFIFPFPIFAPADLEVYLDGALQSGGFAVGGAGQDEGGSVHFDAPPPAGARVTLRRRLAVQRTTDFQEGGDFRAKTLNDELDYQTAAIQQLERQQERALALGPADADVAMVLPAQQARAGRLLGFDGAGQPIAYELGAAPLQGDATIITAEGTATPRSLTRRFSDRVNILDFGARRDGASDDLPAFQAARAKAGADGAVWLPGPGTYYFAGSRPDLSGCAIEADPGVVIKTDENPNTPVLRLAAPLTVENPAHGTRLTKPANLAWPVPLHNLGAAAAAALEAARTRPALAALDFTQGWTAASISGTATKGASTATVEPDKLSWAAPFGAGQEGVFSGAPPLVGESYEATFRSSAASAVGGFVSAILISDAKRYDFALMAGLPQLQVIENPGGTVKTVALPNGNAYSLVAAGASVTLGLRIVDAKTVEVSVNDLLVHSHTVGNFLAEIGFAVSWHLSGTTAIHNGLRGRGLLPQSARPLKLAVVGDSISYGAWASLAWPELLKGMAPNLPGIGRLEVVNHAISGTRSVEWANAIDSYDFAGRDFVLVLLGTNDAQSQTDPAVFAANLGAIADRIVAQGAKPVFGVFPVYTVAAVSGITGVPAMNYEKGALLRSLVKRFCALRGYEAANVQDAFGSSLGWYGDNLHPTVDGQVAVAKAFAAALCRAVAPKPVSGHGGWIRPALLNGWTSFSPTHQEPQYRLRPDGMVELRGSVKGGTVGTTTPILRLPPGFRPNLVRSFGITTGDPTASAGELFVFPGSSDGNVALGKGSNTKVNLNGILFEPEQ